ncbi:hypothetical protein AB0G71_17425 [Streptomyces sp. NPDC020403]
MHPPIAHTQPLPEQVAAHPGQRPLPAHDTPFDTPFDTVRTR